MKINNNIKIVLVSAIIIFLIASNIYLERFDLLLMIFGAIIISIITKCPKK